MSIECLVDRVLRLGTEHLVIGRMVRSPRRCVRSRTARRGRGRLQPLGRLAGNYTKVETIFELPSEDSS